MTRAAREIHDVATSEVSIVVSIPHSQENKSLPQKQKAVGYGLETSSGCRAWDGADVGSSDSSSWEKSELHREGPRLCLPQHIGSHLFTPSLDAGNSQEIGFAAVVSLQNAGEGDKSMEAIRNLVLLSARALFLIKSRSAGGNAGKG